jgi:predicted ATP-dependent Lon-type protease
MGMMTDEEAYELIDFAAEGRKRVKDQLYIIDETFMAEPAKFVYQKVKTGEEVPVETLENISNGMAAEPTSTAVATEESNRTIYFGQTSSHTHIGRAQPLVQAGTDRRNLP